MIQQLDDHFIGQASTVTNYIHKSQEQIICTEGANIGAAKWPQFLWCVYVVCYCRGLSYVLNMKFVELFNIFLNIPYIVIS